MVVRWYGAVPTAPPFHCPTVRLTMFLSCMLDDRFTTPRSETIAALRECPGGVVVLGAGGKMGPSLTAMVVRASRDAGSSRRVFAVSRWSDADARRDLEAAGAMTVNCDLLDRDAVSALPDAANVIF